MTSTLTLTVEQKNHLLSFLKKNKNVDAVMIYCAYLEDKNRLKPVLCKSEKIVCQNVEDLLRYLDTHGKLCREKEIEIQYGRPRVDKDTTRMYMCPHKPCDWVVGTNMVPRAGDDIVDHVAKCVHNHEIIGGLKAKRFTICDDKEIIKTFISEKTTSVKKICYYSPIIDAVKPKVYNSKQAVIDDVKKSCATPISFYDVAVNVLSEEGEKKFKVGESLETFVYKHFDEGNVKIQAFLEALSALDEFKPYSKKWLSEEE